MKDLRIAVVGLGYVGLPLACLFATKYNVTGFDINANRVDCINKGIDKNRDIEPEKLTAALATGMHCTSSPSDIADCNVYIVAVPTPVDADHNPDLSPLIGATRVVGQHLTSGNIVVYESTVYPGTTEEVCAPILEELSGLRLNEGFFIGYSPERINPGDREHTVENIMKITSGSTPEAADLIDALYNSVLTNGTFHASSIQVAEAAKVIENAQRDVNIAFINEIAKVFDTLNIPMRDVIEAASTKWNFISLRPGLVGGHCIGVDPYYLIQRAQSKGFNPTLMSEARRINDTMSYYVAERVTTELNIRGTLVREAKILILGFAFKPNCSDIRNTKVADVYNALTSFTPNVYVYDPLVCPAAAKQIYGIDVISDTEELAASKYDVIIQCINHKEFDNMSLDAMLNDNGFVFYICEPAYHITRSRSAIVM